MHYHIFKWKVFSLQLLNDYQIGRVGNTKRRDWFSKAAISAGQLIVKSFQDYIGHHSSKLQLNYVGKMSFFQKYDEID